jgi:hypothetical protein
VLSVMTLWTSPFATSACWRSQHEIALRPEQRADAAEQASQQSHHGPGEVTSPAGNPQGFRCGRVLGRDSQLGRHRAATERAEERAELWNLRPREVSEAISRL